MTLRSLCFLLFNIQSRKCTQENNTLIVCGTARRSHNRTETNSINRIERKERKEQMGFSALFAFLAVKSCSRFARMFRDSDPRPQRRP